MGAGLPKLTYERTTSLTWSGDVYWMGCQYPSGADVFDRITIFEDHLVRDIDCGRFPQNTNLVFITHGLTLRIFLARWFHWTVKELESVWNPINSEPIVMERVAAEEQFAEVGSRDSLLHHKSLSTTLPAAFFVRLQFDPGHCIPTAFRRLLTPRG